MKISIVMIVKNEEALLARCLESVKDADEVIVCDTGSADGTLDVARRYTDKVFTDFAWVDNFAAARNHAKSKATGDWILSIDADEVLTCPFGDVRKAAELGYMAVNVSMHSEYGAVSQFWFPRLFKNCEQVWWEGAVHNHLSVMGEDVSTFPTITFGYSPAHHQDKMRTLRILENEVASRPECVRERFYLGREYFYRSMHEKALPMLGRYVQQSRFLAEKADAFLMMARAYWELRMPDDARDACVQALIINPHFKEAVLFMATLAGDGTENVKWQRNADQWKRMAATADNEGVLFLREQESAPDRAAWDSLRMAVLPKDISACFITKDAAYPQAILERVMRVGFGECLFLTNCPSPHFKQKLFEKAQFEHIYYQDDDCIAPIAQLLEAYVPGGITCAMKATHLAAYKESRIALLGWGSIFPKSTIKVLDGYRRWWGEDELYRRETERIMTYLSFPQQRLELPIEDLPSAMAPDRLSMQPEHYDYIPRVERRCEDLLARESHSFEPML